MNTANFIENYRLISAFAVTSGSLLLVIFFQFLGIVGGVTGGIFSSLRGKPVLNSIIYSSSIFSLYSTTTICKIYAILVFFFISLRIVMRMALINLRGRDSQLTSSMLAGAASGLLLHVVTGKLFQNITSDFKRQFYT